MFTGIELDSLKCEARLPFEKVEKCIQPIGSFLSRKKVTLRELSVFAWATKFCLFCCCRPHVFKTINSLCDKAPVCALRWQVGKQQCAHLHPEMTPQLAGMITKYVFIGLPSNGYENRT